MEDDTTNGPEGTAAATAVEREDIQLSEPDTNPGTNPVENKLVRPEPDHEFSDSAGASNAAVEEKTDDAGFAPFRFWVNRQIRSQPGGVTLMYGGVIHTVTELTPDGRLRLEYEGSFNLIPLDDRVIPKLFQQIL